MEILAYTKWEGVACSDFKTAEDISREAVRGRLSIDTEVAAERSGRKFRPGEVMAKATMDDGWSVEVREAGKLSAAEKYALKSIAARQDSQKESLKR